MRSSCIEPAAHDALTGAAVRTWSIPGKKLKMNGNFAARVRALNAIW